MLRRPATVLQITADDIADYEGRRETAVSAQQQQREAQASAQAQAQAQENSEAQAREMEGVRDAAPDQQAEAVRRSRDERIGVKAKRGA